MNTKCVYLSDSSMFLHTILRRLTAGLSSEVAGSSSLLRSSDDLEVQAETGSMSRTELDLLKKSKLRRITLLISVTFVTIIVLSIVVYFLLHGLSLAVLLVHHQKIECEESDSLCLESRCPVGMRWSQTENYCLVLDNFQCCTASNMTRACYDPQVSLASLEECQYTSKTAGVSPFLKQYCRPGLVWVEWLGQCLTSKGRG